MRISNFFFILFASPFLFFPNQTKQNYNYISLEFANDHIEKPMPVIVFYLDSFETDNLSFVGRKFKIKKEEFGGIEKVIKEESSYIILDSNAVRYYDIDIVKKNTKTKYGTVNLTKTKQLIFKIIEQLRTSKKYEEIFKTFDNLYLLLKE